MYIYLPFNGEKYGAPTLVTRVTLEEIRGAELFASANSFQQVSSE